MRDPRREMWDAGSEMRDAGSEMRDARCGMRGFRVMFPSRIPHPASRQDRFRCLPELRFVLLREWSFREPNVEARTAGRSPELDDPRRRAIDHVDQGLQGLPPPVSRLPVVLRGHGDNKPLRLQAACHVALQRDLNGGGYGGHRW